MTLVGFKRLTIGIHDAQGNVIKKHVVEGKQDQGATTTADITGLSKEPTRVYGSDVAYYVSNVGTGDVTVNLGLLDLPDEVNDEILGYEITESGVAYVGSTTQAPYCSIMLESSNLQNEKAMLGFFKGKFGKDAINLRTLDGSTYTPEAEAYVFTAVNDTKDGPSNGMVLGKFIGEEDAAGATELEGQVFSGDTSGV